MFDDERNSIRLIRCLSAADRKRRVWPDVGPNDVHCVAGIILLDAPLPLSQPTEIMPYRSVQITRASTYSRSFE